MPIFSKIISTGSALPEQCVSNHRLVERLAALDVQTSDEWIVSRTGIRQRYLSNDFETTGHLGTKAAQAALEAVGVAASQVDLIILATSTSDQIFPSTACSIQKNLGNVGAAAFDIQAVCSGFVYALTVADAMIKAGQARYALVIGAEVFSRIMDWSDRTTCVLFGDGAGAVLLGQSDTPGILASKLHADGSQGKILCTAGRISEGTVSGDPFLRMDGQAVFKQAVSVLGDNALEVLGAAGMKSEQLDWLVPHQANIRILQSVSRKLSLSFDKVVVTVDQHGNTSAASVPLALDLAVKDGRIRAGQHVLLQGVGGGFTWGSVLMRM